MDFINGDPMPIERKDQALDKFLEQANTPCNVNTKHYHLTELAVHKTIHGGQMRQKVIIKDMIRDIGEVSEWVMIELCRWVRLQESPFFPTDGSIPRKAKELQAKYAKLNESTEKEDLPMIEKPKDRSDWTRTICQSYPNKDYSIIAVMPKIHMLISKAGAENVLNTIETEKPQVEFNTWLDQQLSILS